MDKRLVESAIIERLSGHAEVLAACIYGSWLYEVAGTDVDMAVFIASDDGLVHPDTYRRLRSLRDELCLATGQDIDLVPHTEDEFSDHNSPLWYPRYNPSLVCGKVIKGVVPICHVSSLKHAMNMADSAAYVIQDNRTICRRQMVRSLSPQESRIFSSKLLHGPGNALTLMACRTGVANTIPPSDLVGSIKSFDLAFGVDTSSAVNTLLNCRENLNFDRALKLMAWYEALMNLCLKGGKWADRYHNACYRLK